jgi:NADH:ubiquinone oxidoreductase subunit 6 (subunit J)
MTWIMVDAFGDSRITVADADGTKTRAVGEVIFSTYVLPFEVVSVLLLAALVGAVVMARKD